uniref:EH domain-binding protein 1 n=1 Tax=Romanomermis culicivorax TaxID=13658 RepID=A0A915JKI8_ROMCU
MYRDSRNESFDDKEWTFIVEEITNSGKRKPVAGINLNMRLFVQEPGAQTELKLKLKPLRENLIDCRLKLSLSCWPSGPEGDAFDEDMRSVASQMSVQNSAVATAKESSTIDDFLQQQQTSSAEQQNRGDHSDLECKKNDLFGSSNEGNLAESTSREIEKVLQSLDDSLQMSVTSENKLRGLTLRLKNKSTSKSDDNQTKLNKRQSFLDNENDTSSDLMTWCKNVTRNYKNVKIDDFSTSWRNGLAFCAMIHHFRPDLIDYELLDAKNIYKNCSLAFDTAANLGAPKIISPADMVVLAIPDKIAVMTYVSLLRDLFTSPSSKASKQCSENSKFRLFRNSFTNDVDSTKQKDQKVINNQFNSEHLTLRLSTENIQKPNLMTRNQLMNPFDSSDEDLIAEKGKNGTMIGQAQIASDPILDIRKSDQIEFSDDGQKSKIELSPKDPDPGLSADQIPSPTTATSATSRALKLLEQYEKRPLSSLNNDDDEKRRRSLQERARKLIQDAKSGNLYNNTTTTPSNICKTVKMTDVVKPVQYHNNNGEVSEEKNVNFTTNIVQMNKSRQNLEKSKSLEKCDAGGDDEMPATLTASVTFENFKRFGSMRGQELVDSVNLLSEKLTRTLKNSQSNLESKFIAPLPRSGAEESLGKK